MMPRIALTDAERADLLGHLQGRMAEVQQRAASAGRSLTAWTCDPWRELAELVEPVEQWQCHFDFL